jgi:aspartate oxidase
MTNVPGLYAAGECEYQYHGANRLGANALLACLVGGEIAAEGIISFAGKRIALAKDITIVAPMTPASEEEWPTRVHPGFRRCTGCDAPLSLRTRGELCRACFDTKRAEGAGVSVCASCIHAPNDKCSFGYPEAFTREADDCALFYDGVIP